MAVDPYSAGGDTPPRLYSISQKPVRPTSNDIDPSFKDPKTGKMTEAGRTWLKKAQRAYDEANEEEVKVALRKFDPSIKAQYPRTFWALCGISAIVVLAVILFIRSKFS